MANRIILPAHFHAASRFPTFDLSVQHAQVCEALDRIVHDAMAPEDKENFLPHDAAFYRKKIEGGHKIVGAFNGDTLIAKANMVLDLRAAEHAPMLYKHLTLQEFADYVMISGAATHPDYKRQGLQTDLVKARALLALEAGKKYLMAVFAEGSDQSRDNCVKMGMSAMTPFEPSIFFGTPVQFFKGRIEDALAYKRD